MDAASNRGVDEIAALLERAVYAPVDARFKVYMIDEVHMLTNHAFNAMLKTLEEPPPHVKFILATTDPQKIPVTVLSRCLQFNLKQMPAGHIVSHLERILGEENIAHEAQALRLLARAADGSMRDALSLTDQAIAYSANQVTEEAVRGMLGALDQNYLIRLLVAGDGAAVLAVADEMALRSLSFSTALQDLAGLLHKIAWAQFAPSSVLEEWPEAADLRRFADALSPEQVQLFYQIATIGRSELGLAPDEYAGFTMTLLRMLAFEPAPHGGGGGVTPAGRSTVPAAAGSKRAGAPVAAAAMPQARAAAVAAPRVAPAAKPEPVSADPRDVREAPASQAPGNEPEPEIAAAPVDDVEDTPESTARPAAMLEAQDSADVSGVELATPDDAGASQSAAAPQAQPEPAPRRAGGASAALDVLRNAGMKVSTDRGRAASPAPAASTPAAAAKPAAPRMPVRVPTPDPARRAAAQQETSARAQTPPRAAQQPGSPVPPWEDIPPDEYMPASSDDAFFAPPDDNFIPVFDSGPDDVLVGRGNAPAATPAAASVVDIRTLPPAVPLDAIGFDGDWPALAVTLPLKGISYQLAFNSELMAVDGKTLKLNVAVQLYAEPAQIAKLRAALAEKLGSEIDVLVEVGPVQRTAAVLDAIERAKRQQEAEREIGADPFVQSLIREFGASIVPGSIRPLTPGGEGGLNAAGH